MDITLYRVPAILVALTIHELAHGWVALKCGDSTAKNAGRLTLNPLSHLDLLGTVMLLFGPFGWAKPVPVNGHNLSNPKCDLALISAAGPISNIILALIIGYVIRVLYTFVPNISSAQAVFDILNLGVLINIGIAFFNLLPIPPLDGSKILLGLMPERYVPQYITISKYFPMIFMVLLVGEWLIPESNLLSSILNPLFLPFYTFWTSLIF
ncbi:site-2 protease family protein [Chitinispirillales bacterium ANBcel5]|uniref:site-2 protease family protein n=1 Tax=Cellulosispirillum alkaliphilum TaxID=3039283 RepID=UPI002A55CFDA|nr:site-2 protease family protein [Chitinispirillales bacterium ANBcel5]